MIPDYFPERPWACRCGCGFDAIRPELVERLNLARHLAGVPFDVTSACRCDKHNRVEGGVPGGAHLTGEAADIRVPSSSIRHDILSGVIRAGFKRIGIAKTFIHADIAVNMPHPRIWLYE